MEGKSVEFAEGSLDIFGNGVEPPEGEAGSVEGGEEDLIDLGGEDESGDDAVSDDGAASGDEAGADVSSDSEVAVESADAASDDAPPSSPIEEIPPSDEPPAPSVEEAGDEVAAGSAETPIDDASPSAPEDDTSPPDKPPAPEDEARSPDESSAAPVEDAEDEGVAESDDTVSDDATPPAFADERPPVEDAGDGSVSEDGADGYDPSAFNFNGGFHDDTDSADAGDGAPEESAPEEASDDTDIEPVSTDLKPARFNRGAVQKIGLALVAVLIVLWVVFRQFAQNGGKPDESAAARRAGGARFLAEDLENAKRVKPAESKGADNAAASDDSPSSASGGGASGGRRDLYTEFSHEDEPPVATGPPRYGDAPDDGPRPEESLLVPNVEGRMGQMYRGASGQSTPSSGMAAYDERLAQARAESEAKKQQAQADAQERLAQMQRGAPSAYDSQNAQDDKKAFYGGAQDGSTITGGQYLMEDTIWTGTIIPGVLITSINTDLPGDVLARVSRNIYDSRTGKHLLIPQGSTLVAKYNSSISYAQSRVQIVWNTLIRPDGYQVQLGGMNGVDSEGHSGQGGQYHENWFQYAKAAGIIALFSLINLRMSDAAIAAAGGPSQATAEMITANQSMVNQLGSDVMNRALNIQPTITVDSGTPINIMLNRNIYLPYVEDYPVKEKYKR